MSRKLAKLRRTANAAKLYRRMMADKPLALRPYGNPLNRICKAIEYATWIAARDGITLPRLRPQVSFVPCAWHGFTSPTQVACGVRWGDVYVSIPHWNFDPTAPALECIDEAQLSLAA